MTRRSSKIKEEEVISARIPAKKLVRKAGRPKKEEILIEKKTAVKVKVTTKARVSTVKQSQENDKAAVLNEIKSSYSTTAIPTHDHNEADKIKETADVNTPQLKFRPDSRAIYEKEEQKKILIMWLGVGVLMFLIAGFWIYDTKKIFQQSNLDSSANNDFSFDKLSASVKDVTSKIDELKQELAKASSTLATTSEAAIVATSTLATSSDLVQGVIRTEISSTSEESKPELIVKELQSKLMASTTENGKVRGVSEERDVIGELRNKLEK